MRSNAPTTSRATQGLAVIVVWLLASSAGAQTVEPAVALDLTSATPKATQ